MCKLGLVVGYAIGTMTTVLLISADTIIKEIVDMITTF